MNALPYDLPSALVLVRQRPEVLGQIFQVNPPLALQITQQLSQPTSLVETAGGAVVHESVDTAGGHFIGRDFVQVVIQSLAKGEDTEDAKNNVALYLAALIAI